MGLNLNPGPDPGPCPIKNKEEQIMAEKDEKKEKEATEEKGVPVKYLAGLTYRDSEEREITDPDTGKKSTVYAPREKPLKAKDVLSWKDYGDEIVIVAGDGRKHRVKK
jgi:hypothetical protein